jgi:hypothetical protein
LWFWVLVVFSAWLLIQCIVVIGVGAAHG